MNQLFSSLSIGAHSLKNRIVMSPMTRSRAISNLPNELMAEYYSQRADAGLIITEGTSPSPNGLGYARIPGIFSEEQVSGWRKVTEAVHKKGGKIFVQIMHTGRVGHPLNLPKGAEIIAPSAITLKGEIWTDAQGNQPYGTPREMQKADIEKAIQEYAVAAENALSAGFDGVELHGANGYLIDQFLNPGTNHRSDEYGGSIENRNRFAVEVAREVAKRIGPEKVGIRISPFGVFNSLEIYDGIEEQYSTLAKELGTLKLAYVHIVDHSSMGAPKPEENTVRRIREEYKKANPNGLYILSGGYDVLRSDSDLKGGRGDLIAFGRNFISNPDLVDRLRKGQTLENPNPDTFYTPGPKGYTDYKVLAENSHQNGVLSEQLVN
ncbi:alkene reductase [Leptospira perolatii]|uniref:Alkene reductase n=1 Tax=Leptospira perolatii TaxID=2023191 RepID=A0A2M9ZS50_9LEPT|nr:alkene reductase [Leptospira perolatii]PJZ71376.1 alkene reductase [Leptospira perolatii]PJZ74910.1 alkene reductase [Leptospira perolatii]